MKVVLEETMGQVPTPTIESPWLKDALNADICLFKTDVSIEWLARYIPWKVVCSHNSSKPVIVFFVQGLDGPRRKPSPVRLIRRWLSILYCPWQNAAMLKMVHASSKLKGNTPFPDNDHSSKLSEHRSKIRHSNRFGSHCTLTVTGESGKTIVVTGSEFPIGRNLNIVQVE